MLKLSQWDSRLTIIRANTPNHLVKAKQNKTIERTHKELKFAHVVCFVKENKTRKPCT